MEAEALQSPFAIWNVPQGATKNTADLFERKGISSFHLDRLQVQEPDLQKASRRRHK